MDAILFIIVLIIVMCVIGFVGSLVTDIGGRCSKCTSRLTCSSFETEDDYSHGSEIRHKHLYRYCFWCNNKETIRYYGKNW